MYTRRIQLVNYGPIATLDIELAFDDNDTPKPVVLVGGNGSGKSILLSHIVNGLVAAQGVAFPETPAVAAGKVYKLRADMYIRTGCTYYFGRVDFDDGFFVSELRSVQNKDGYPTAPDGILGTPAEAVWNKMEPKDSDYFDSNISSAPDIERRVKDTFAKHCVLYFPFSRHEEPAWLNEGNLTAKAQYMDLPHVSGATSRRVIASSPLHHNQNWLFDVVYDMTAFEVQTQRVNLPVNDGNATMPLPLFFGYAGDSATTHEAALRVVRAITQRDDARFGIGRRKNRVVSIQSGTGPVVPNIFQLSSGETSLLNLFLSILRDFDLSGAEFSNTEDIRGIVVVDEIDLHLHAVHQHEVLPKLMEMFPKVQFIVTTHSPLFVLGMQRTFGDEGFALYRLPQGEQISPEEFSEFGEAYEALAGTRKFSADMRAAIAGAQKPIVFVEGKTGVKYVRKAAELFGSNGLLERIELQDGGGVADLGKFWKSCTSIPPGVVPHDVILLADCDSTTPDGDRGKILWRRIPERDDTPLRKGIENLFGRDTLERAVDHKPAFIDIVDEHAKKVRGEHRTVAEQWTVNANEKTNLCRWLCDNGTAEDFDGFRVIFDLLEDVLESSRTRAEGS